jgi:GAF domain-containing protein
MPSGLEPRQLALLNRLARVAMEDLEPRSMQQRITDALAEHFGWEFVALISIDRERNRFVCEALSTALPTEIHVGYSRELGSGVVGQVASRGEPVLVSDADQYPGFVHTLPGGRAELAMPIRHRGEVVGVLNLESRTPAIFDDQVELLGTVCEQIAGGLKAARQNQELERRATQLSLVAEITRDALEAGELESLLERVLAQLQRHYDTLEATVLLEADLRDHLEVMAHRGASPHITRRGKLWPVGDGIVGRCFRSGEVQFIADVARDRDYQPVNPRVGTELALPVKFRERVFGVINLETANATAFDQLTRTTLRTLADLLGGAIHLAALNRRLAASQNVIDRQGVRIVQTHESLRRAVSKLKRRRGVDVETGLIDATAFESKVAARLRRAHTTRHHVLVAMARLAPHAGQIGAALSRASAGAIEAQAERLGWLPARTAPERFAFLADIARGEEMSAALDAMAALQPMALAAIVVPPAVAAKATQLLGALEQRLDAAATATGVMPVDVAALALPRRGRGRPRKPSAG